MRSTLTRTAAAAAVVLALGLAACGDDDDATDATAATEAAGGDTAAFCDALVEFNSEVSNVDTEGASEEQVKEIGETLAPLFQRIADNAPDDLADTADELNGTVQPLLEGDTEAFDADETFETYTGFLSDAVGSCDYETVEVTAVDYAFEGVPDSVPAGTLAFELTNASEAEEHEMIVFRRADGVTQSFDEILNLPEEETEELIVFSAAAFAPPGESGATLADLDAGEYAMVCFIPVGGAEDGPPHFTAGMIKEFIVE